MIPSHHASLALQAMQRAAEEAKKKASDKNLKMPLWKNGEIVFIDPKNATHFQGDTHDPHQ